MFKCKNVHLVLHGGLGNQLFQFQAALKVASVDSIIIIYTYELNNYKTKRHFELLPILLDSFNFKIRSSSNNVFIRFRLPKLIAYILKKEIILRIPFIGIIVDGYFINKDFYKINSIEKTIHSIMKQKMSIPQCYINKTLIHLRMTDFFNNSLDAQNFAEKRIREINSPVDIITDDESIVKMILNKYQKHNLVKIISTKNMNAWDLLKAIASYKYIFSNGSTLALWAAWLGNAKYRNIY